MAAIEPAATDIADWPAEGLEPVGACPVCGCDRAAAMHDGLTDLSFGVAPGRWRMQKCLGCGSGYLDPRPSASHLGLAYGSYYTHAAPQAADPRPSLAARLRAAVGNSYVNARFGSRLAPAMPGGALLVRAMPQARQSLECRFRHLPKLPRGGGSLLDVGCGNGAFLVHARALGWQATGVEPDPQALAAGRAAGLDIRAGGIEALAGQAALFDQITISHVIEHVPDPGALLVDALRLLRPGGRLFLETPNIASPGHRRFGASWRGLEAPRHLQVFSPGGLRALVVQTGFTGLVDLPAEDPRPVLDAESRAMAVLAGAKIGKEGPDRGQAYHRLDPDRREFLTLAAFRPDD